MLTSRWSMDKQTSVTAYATGAFTTLVGSITLQEVAIWVGIICTVCTFLVNWWYKHKEDARAEQRFKQGQ